MSTLPTQNNRSSQLLPYSKFVAHHPKAGLNPLVDTAAYLFSLIGKLKNTKTYRNLAKLQSELTQEIHTFQTNAKTFGYSAEYILASRYALCATIDDTIIHTHWGAEGQWENYSLLTTFNQESTHPERFFIILERISKDPALYIDIMELMYVCLSLGFKGSYRNEVHKHHELEQITNALYKRIRNYRGNFSKTLSPFPLRQPVIPKIIQRKISISFIMLITASLILALFISLGYLLDTVSKQAYQELMTIGKAIIYESTP